MLEHSQTEKNKQKHLFKTDLLFEARILIKIFPFHLQSQSDWEKVFLTAAIIHFCGVLFYGIFASGEKQPWAEPPLHSEPQWSVQAGYKAYGSTAYDVGKGYGSVNGNYVSNGMVNGGYGMKHSKHSNGGAQQDLPTPSSDTTHDTESEFAQEWQVCSCGEGEGVSK